MPTVTALRPRSRGRVLVELDGVEWRTLPGEVAVRAGLASGLELGRPELRELRRDLRRTEALATACRALERGDLSTHGLKERLVRAGFPRATREEALGILARAGLLDDPRSARLRAELLARRDAGDAMILADLESRGYESEVASQAMAQLEPETTRASCVSPKRGSGVRLARYLARRGFSEDAIETALTRVDVAEARRSPVR